MSSDNRDQLVKLISQYDALTKPYQPHRLDRWQKLHMMASNEKSQRFYKANCPKGAVLYGWTGVCCDNLLRFIEEYSSAEWEVMDVALSIYSQGLALRNGKKRNCLQPIEQRMRERGYSIKERGRKDGEPLRCYLTVMAEVYHAHYPSNKFRVPGTASLDKIEKTEWQNHEDKIMQALTLMPEFRDDHPQHINKWDNQMKRVIALFSDQPRQPTSGPNRRISDFEYFSRWWALVNGKVLKMWAPSVTERALKIFKTRSIQ